ncbi:helix-turn-helix domain-containing protein [Kitasatospora cheerisanensis]|nr:helix-turn-helix transcriptional regulator [Kitasatospora cheerisanensis]
MIADEVKRLRKRRGVSAQQLSEKCEDLGLAIPRSVIANFESKRRLTISVPELIILARALEVPPVSLIFPVGHSGAIEMLPGVNVEPMSAIRYLTGSAAPLGVDAEEYKDHQMFLYREHEAKVDHIQVLARRVEEARRQLARLLAEANDSRATESRERDLRGQLENLENRSSSLVIGLSQAELKGYSDDAPAVISMIEEFREATKKISEIRQSIKYIEETRRDVDYPRWILESNLLAMRDQRFALNSIRRRIELLGVDLPNLPDAVLAAFSDLDSMLQDEEFIRGKFVEPVNIVDREE